jgi:hypothetical protein
MCDATCIFYGVGQRRGARDHQASTPQERRYLVREGNGIRRTGRRPISRCRERNGPICTKAAAFHRLSGSSRYRLARSAAMTCPLRSAGITPLHHHCGAVRPLSGPLRSSPPPIRCIGTFGLAVVWPLQFWRAARNLLITPSGWWTNQGQTEHWVLSIPWPA